jgi:hypothetical protein
MCCISCSLWWQAASKATLPGAETSNLIGVCHSTEVSRFARATRHVRMLASAHNACKTWVSALSKTDSHTRREPPRRQPVPSCKSLCRTLQTTPLGAGFWLPRIVGPSTTTYAGHLPGWRQQMSRPTFAQDPHLREGCPISCSSREL